MGACLREAQLFCSAETLLSRQSGDTDLEHGLVTGGKRGLFICLSHSCLQVTDEKYLYFGRMGNHLAFTTAYSFNNYTKSRPNGCASDL